MVRTYDGSKEVDTSKGNALVLSQYFRKTGETLGEFTQEFKQLTEEDKEQLAGGIRDGSETY